MRANHVDGVVEVHSAGQHHTVGVSRPLISAHVEPARSAVSTVQSHGVERGRGTAGVGDGDLPCPAHTGAARTGVEQVDHATVVGQHVFGFRHGVGGRGGVHIAHRAQAHQQLVGGHDGVVAVHVAKAVVGGCRARGHQHTGVTASSTHTAVAAGDGGQGGEVAAALTTHKPDITHAVIAHGIGLTRKAGVVVGGDGQCFLDDVGTQAGGLRERVVGYCGTGDGVGRCHGNACTHIDTGKGARLHQGQRFVVLHTDQKATCQHCAGGAVIGFVGDRGARHG